MPVVLDNNKLGAVGEYIKENTKCGAEITISSPIFTIYAFEGLRKVLEKSDKFSNAIKLSIWYLSSVWHKLCQRFFNG